MEDARDFFEVRKLEGKENWNWVVAEKGGPHIPIHYETKKSAESALRDWTSPDSFRWIDQSIGPNWREYRKYVTDRHDAGLTPYDAGQQQEEAA